MSTAPSAEALARAKDVFVVARVLVQSCWPYLTAGVMRLVPRWTPEVPTIGVDRHMRLYMNPVYVSRLSAPTLALVLAGHELQHVLGGHADRLVRYRDRAVALPTGGTAPFANVCHDLGINSGLKDYADSAAAYRRLAGAPAIDMEPPAGGLYPHQFCDCANKRLVPGLISEEYAELLDYAARDPAPGPAPGPSCGSGAGGPPQPWEDPTDPVPGDPSTGAPAIEIETVRHQVAEAARAQAAQHRGTVPGRDRHWAEVHLRPPKVPWPRVLRRVVQRALAWAAGRTDWSWQRPARRTFGAVLMPGMVAPYPDLLVAVDRSGSMTNAADTDATFAELYALCKLYGFGRGLPVFVVDAEAYAVQYVRRIEDLVLEGGGGTDMRVAVARAVELKKKLLIVVTDGMTEWGDAPPLKVVVCLTRHPVPGYPPPSWATVVVCVD